MYTFKIYEPVRRNVRPVDNGDTVPGLIPVAKYFREMLNCDCSYNETYKQGKVIEVLKDTSCCKTDKQKIVRTSIINNKTNQNGYYMNHKQYLKSRCISLDNVYDCCNC